MRKKIYSSIFFSICGFERAYKINKFSIFSIKKVGVLRGSGKCSIFLSRSDYFPNVSTDLETRQKMLNNSSDHFSLKCLFREIRGGGPCF